MNVNGFVKVGLGLAAAGAGAALATRRVSHQWSAQPDVNLPGDRLLPIGETRRIAASDGGFLATTIAGPANGPIVVLAHGYTNAREVWAPVAHRLVRKGFRVVAYDQRGHGSSTAGTEGFTMERLADDLRAVLEAVSAEDAVLVGHSMGGMTIQSLATHDPEALTAAASAIVLVATSAYGLGGVNATADRSAAKVVSSAAAERAVGAPGGYALLRNVVGKTVRKADLVLAQQLFLATTREARADLLAAMQSMDLRKGNATISLPTTILVGSKDKLTPPAMAEALVRSIPGSCLVRLEGFGHMLPLEAPDAVVDAIVAASARTDAIGHTSGSLA